MEIICKLAKFLKELRFQDLPTSTVEGVKKQILDVLGTALAGGRSQGVEEVYELVKEWGGKEESSVINWGGKFPSPNAAFVNSTMAHALDYDDTHEGGIQHPAVVAVPTAFAVAQAIGDIKGKDFITAIAAGADLGCRLGRATKSAKPILQGGWHYTSLYGYFNAATVTSNLYHFDENILINALGIAYHQAAGNLQCIRDGALTKRMSAGFASRGGITAALLAARGITGAKDIIESDLGIFNLYHAGYDEQALLDGLGKEFASETTSFKPYPCCRLNHPYIDAFLSLVKDKDIKPEDVEEIVVEYSSESQLLCEPYEAKSQPRDIVDSQFSLPWVLACAIVMRKVGLAEFTGKSIRDDSLISMAKKVKPRFNPSIPKWDSPASIRVRTEREEFETRTSCPLGSPENPLNFEQLEEKFKDCASFALKTLSETDLEEIITMIKNLEEVENVGKILEIIS